MDKKEAIQAMMDGKKVCTWIDSEAIWYAQDDDGTMNFMNDKGLVNMNDIYNECWEIYKEPEEKPGEEAPEEIKPTRREQRR